MSNTNEKSYAELHRPASSFDNRDAYLEHELEILNPKRATTASNGKTLSPRWPVP